MKGGPRVITCSKCSTDLILPKNVGMSTWGMPHGKILIFGTSDAAARFMVWMLELRIDLINLVGGRGQGMWY